MCLVLFALLFIEVFVYSLSLAFAYTFAELLERCTAYVCHAFEFAHKLLSTLLSYALYAIELAYKEVVASLLSVECYAKSVCLVTDVTNNL